MGGVELSAANGPAKWAAIGALAAAGACALLWSYTTRPRVDVRDLPSRVEGVRTPLLEDQAPSEQAQRPAEVSDAPVTVYREQPNEVTAAQADLPLVPDSFLTSRDIEPSRIIEIRVIGRPRYGPPVEDDGFGATVAHQQGLLSSPEPRARDAAPATPMVESPPMKPAGETSPKSIVSAPGSTTRINLNTASKAELELLPGVGPALATRIMEERQKQRFARVDDLDRVKGIGPKILERLRPFVTVDAPPKPR
jgi:competence ComEA-like helix-hairpin-helix protein